MSYFEKVDISDKKSLDETGGNIRSYIESAQKIHPDYDFSLGVMAVCESRLLTLYAYLICFDEGSNDYLSYKISDGFLYQKDRIMDSEPKEENRIIDNNPTGANCFLRCSFFDSHNSSNTPLEVCLSHIPSVAKSYLIYQGVDSKYPFFWCKEFNKSLVKISFERCSLEGLDFSCLRYFDKLKHISFLNCTLSCCVIKLYGDEVIRMKYVKAVDTIFEIGDPDYPINPSSGGNLIISCSRFEGRPISILDHLSSLVVNNTDFTENLVFDSRVIIPEIPNLMGSDFGKPLKLYENQLKSINPLYKPIFSRGASLVFIFGLVLLTPNSTIISTLILMTPPLTLLLSTVILNTPVRPVSKCITDELRALSKHAERFQLKDEYLLFHAHEMRSKRGSNDPRHNQDKLSSLLNFAMDTLSDYGRSVSRPSLYLIASSFFFFGVYIHQFDDSCQLLEADSYSMSDCSRQAALYSASNTLPFLGMSKEVESNVKNLTEAGGKATIFTTGFQRLISLIFIFLIGLGLRNQFKL